MEKTISASDANRYFSRLLRSVSEGCAYAVTRHGRVVARVIPPGGDPSERKRRERAQKALMLRLRSQAPMNLRWTRDDAYDERVGW